MAKWWCTELQGRVIDAGVQLHGGYGYMTEYPIARAYADARITRIYGGTTEIMKEIIGRPSASDPTHVPAVATGGYPPTSTARTGVGAVSVPGSCWPPPCSRSGRRSSTPRGTCSSRRATTGRSPAGASSSWPGSSAASACCGRRAGWEAVPYLRGHGRDPRRLRRGLVAATSTATSRRLPAGPRRRRRAGCHRQRRPPRRPPVDRVVGRHRHRRRPLRLGRRASRGQPRALLRRPHGGGHRSYTLVDSAGSRAVASGLSYGLASARRRGSPSPSGTSPAPAAEAGPASSAATGAATSSAAPPPSSPTRWCWSPCASPPSAT